MMKILFAVLIATVSLHVSVPAHAAPMACSELFAADTGVSTADLESALAQDLAELAPSLAPQRFAQLRYYFDKLREIKELDRSAIPASILRVLIMLTTTKREIIPIPLESLRLIHPITREAPLQKMEERSEALKAFLLKSENDLLLLDAETLDRTMPSKNLIRVVENELGQFVVFDGNGRLAAIQKAIPNGKVSIEVEVFRSQSKLMRLFLRKVLEVRGLLTPKSRKPSLSDLSNAPLIR